MQVLYEDNHLLVLNKPAGVATMGVEAQRPSLIVQARAYLKQKYQKPGNVYLGVVSRVDALVTGVVIFARTSKAAARLTDQFRRGMVQKTYWALVEPPPQPAEGEWVDWLEKDERLQKVVITTAGASTAKQARLRYHMLSVQNEGALIEVTPLTGRKHQIRVQLAGHGYPVLGDRKYGSRVSFPIGIALHARRLRLEHPVRHAELEFEAPLPKYWRING